MSGTVIRSAVIEMGIRQLQTALTPPNVAAILDAQKAFDQVGVSAAEAAGKASAQWSAFTEKIEQMQAALLETNDSFEKTLADAVAWEETLPGIAANTEQAAQASDHHAAAMTGQIRGLSHMGHGALVAARGVMFLLGADKEHQQQMIENLFLLEGITGATRGVSLVMHGFADSLK